MAADVPKSEFDLLYAQVVELTKAFPEFQFKTVATLSVIIGWLITSEGAQAFVKTHEVVTLPGSMLAFGVLIVLKFIWIVGHKRRIDQMHARLVLLAPGAELPPTALDFLRLGPVLPATYIVVNVIMSAVGMVVVWLICRA